MKIVSSVAESRVHLPAHDLEQAAAVHHAIGDQAVNAAVGRENNAADHDLRDEQNLVHRRVLDHEEDVVAEVRQRYLRRVVRLHHSLLDQRHDYVVRQRAAVRQSQICHREKSADLGAIRHHQSILLALDVPILRLYLLQTASDPFPVNDHRPKFDDA